tara:strand:+ start:32854 stop:33246 length:393 start_codon:yes stop_codon:yes gene_type:complete
MATKISIDVASVVDITARRNDSFYLKTELTNSDGTIYNLEDPEGRTHSVFFEVYDANDILVLAFSSSANSNPLIYPTIDVNLSPATLTISHPSSYFTIRSGTYKYKYYVRSYNLSIVNTIMVGKLKVVDI